MEKWLVVTLDGCDLLVEIRIDLDKCDGCGTCVDVCPAGVFEMKDGKSVAVNVDECLICRACETQCPNNAIKIVE